MSVGMICLSTSSVSSTVLNQDLFTVPEEKAEYGEQWDGGEVTVLNQLIGRSANRHPLTASPKGEHP